MGFLDKLFKKDNVVDNMPKVTYAPKEEVKIDLPENEIVPLNIVDGVLKTDDPINIQIFKHNLEVLIKETKEKGYIDKFMTIRDDDIIPEDYKWVVNSKYTSLDSIGCYLCMEVKKSLNLENILTVSIPSVFRSTKHFTINTPLEITGSYNTVSAGKNVTVMDNLDVFLNSGYAYSLGYMDAYKDITHEPLEISKDAVFLFKKDKFEKQKNSDAVKTIDSKNIMIYEGEEYLAIDMILASKGVLPSSVGYNYANYDDELREILKKSLQKKALDYDLSYEQTHYGKNGHFTSIIDEINGNKNAGNSRNRFTEFVNYLKENFVEYKDIITIDSINDISASREIIEKIGADKIYEAINNFNKLAEEKRKSSYEAYIEDKKGITKEISDIFKTTVKEIDNYFKENDVKETSEELKEIIANFFGSYTVKEQLACAKEVNEAIKNKENVVSR